MARNQTQARQQFRATYRNQDRRIESVVLEANTAEEATAQAGGAEILTLVKEGDPEANAITREDYFLWLAGWHKMPSGADHVGWLTAMLGISDEELEARGIPD